MNYDMLTLTDEQRQAAETYGTTTTDGADVRQLTDDCAPLAKELIERVFADGRTVTQTWFGSAMTDEELGPMQLVAVRVRMDTGTCYTVTVAWPQMEAFSVTAYPLGWHTCICGYDDPAEADGYPPLED